MTSNAIEEELANSRAKFLAFLRRRISDPDLAEDILQDALLRAIKSAPGLHDKELLVPWFYRILSNAVVDVYRRKGKEPIQLDVSAAGSVAAEHEDHAALCGCFVSLLPTLKPEYAELIELLDLGQETPESVAGRLGVTTNNLKVRRHRARQALRRRLEETCRLCAEHHCLDCTCREEGSSFSSPVQV